MGAKLNNGIAKVDAKLSGWFKKSNETYRVYTDMLRDAREAVTQGQRGHFLRDVDKMCADLAENFPREHTV